MKALILRADAKASVETARVLIEKGFQILSVDTQVVAHSLIRVDTIDLLVMDEEIEGQLTHAIALSGERRNPYLSTILLTDRKGAETDDLYDLIPCLYGLASADTAPDLLGELALCAVTNSDVTLARVAQNAVIDAVEAADAFELTPLVLAPADMSPPEDEIESDAYHFADVTTAAPQMAEHVMQEHDAVLERVADVLAEDASQALRRSILLEDVEDAVSAEVAALFRKNLPPHNMVPPQSFAAKAG